MLVVGSCFIVSNASAVSKYNETRLIKVCEAIQSGSKLKVSKRVRDLGISYRELNEKLVCNGEDPISFAIRHGAAKNAEFIAKRAGTELSDSQLDLLAKVAQKKLKQKG